MKKLTKEEKDLALELARRVGRSMETDYKEGLNCMVIFVLICLLVLVFAVIVAVYTALD